jgi:hypothetical protein
MKTATASVVYDTAVPTRWPTQEYDPGQLPAPSRLVVIERGRLRAFLRHQAIALEDLLDLAGFHVRHRLDLRFLPPPLARIMLRLAAAREVAAKTHRDRAGRDLGQARGDHQVADRDSSGDAGSEGERNRKAIRHAHHDVTNGVAGREVLLGMLRVQVHVGFV